MAGRATARRVGVLGGAFDPPHIGHMVLAAEARWQLALDEVRLVPFGSPPHRAAPRTPAAVRLELVRAAIESHPGLVASAVEVDRSGPSFTVDTLTALAAAEPDVEWTLIVGADQVVGFDAWCEPQRIVAIARLGIVARGDVDEAAVVAAAERHAPGRWTLVRMPRIDISSTLVRERAGAGAPFEHLVPPAVARRVAEGGLYGPQSQLP